VFLVFDVPSELDFVALLTLLEPAEVAEVRVEPPPRLALDAVVLFSSPRELAIEEVVLLVLVLLVEPVRDLPFFSDLSLSDFGTLMVINLTLPYWRVNFFFFSFSVFSAMRQIVDNDRRHFQKVNNTCHHFQARVS
jgi:hypothetical protein